MFSLIILAIKKNIKIWFKKKNRYTLNKAYKRNCILKRHEYNSNKNKKNKWIFYQIIFILQNNYIKNYIVQIKKSIKFIKIYKYI